MTLAPGTRLGPYEILSPLGAGGMGEVYRARDTRLERTVAVKVLPSQMSASPEVRQRFEREAKTISQLSHPHICAVHDVGSQGGVEYLVMEYLEGQTLRDKLAAGPLPSEDLLRFGRQIAQALDAAHRRAIVHRDLKPANVMLTRSGVKLLDFGLARALAPTSEEHLTQAATAASGLTQDGFILGTVGYMSPEQAEGKEIDARSDIFALGAVLYEMATGRRAFEGGSRAATLSAVLTIAPPPILSVRPELPPALEPLVSLCLAKDRDRRWQSAHDVDLQLEAIGASSSHPQLAAAKPPRASARWLPWSIAAAFAALTAAALLHRQTAPPAPSMRFVLPPPPGRSYVSTFDTKTVAISPDGARIAYVASPYAASAARRGIASLDPPGARGIWIRELSALEARPVPGTEDATSIFWSPDGGALGFFTPGKLKRILLSGGAPVPICDLPPGPGSTGTWGAGGNILFSGIQAPAIQRVPASGGVPVNEVEVQASREELRFGWPWFLPDGKRFLYLARLRDHSARLMLAEVGKPPRVVAPMASSVQYAEPGFVVFVREGALLGQRFNADAGRLTGEPFSIAEHVNYFLSTGHASFAVSPSGLLAFQSHDDVSHLVWFDRSGRALETIGPPGNYLNVSLASDGRKVFYDRTRPGIGTFDVWSFDLERGVETPITTDSETEFGGIGLPGGKRIVYSANRGSAPELFLRDLETGSDVRLTETQRAFQKAEDLSDDGSTLVYIERTDQRTFDIWTLSLTGASKPTPFLQSPFDKKGVRFSPDGHFLAFVSTESGRAEAYVTPFPGPGQRVRLSSEGASALQWSRDGKELLYVSGDGRMMSVPVRTSPSLQTGSPAPLFAISGKPWLNFEISRDGKRFLAVVPETTADEQPLTVVLNWTASLPR